MSDEEKLLSAAVNVVVDVVLSLIQSDPHQWSSRPCGTCRAISELRGKPFGCRLVATQRKGGGT